MTRDHAERRLTIAIANLLRDRAKPNVWWSHLPMGEARPEKTGALLKRMGTRAGSPDFLVLTEGRALGLELKTEKGRPTATQKECGEAWGAAGGKYFVAYGYQMAVDFLEIWGVLKPDRSLTRPKEAA
jgi:hypothetical protein